MDSIKVTFSMAIDEVVSTEFSTIGEKNENQVSFIDPKEQAYHFQYQPEKISFNRSGAEALEMVFQLGQKSNGTLKVDGFQFVTNVFTKQIRISDQQLCLDYDLLDGNKIISNHQLMVKWEKQWKEI